MATSENSDPKLEVEESLLYSARHGELKVVKALLEAKKEGKLTLDIDCKGLMDSISEELRLDTWTRNIRTTSVYAATLATGLYPPPSHRFASCFPEIAPKDAARIIIEGIRQNHRIICIPTFMKTLIDFNNLMPYRIRIILTDFFNFGHRGWFCFC